MPPVPGPSMTPVRQAQVHADSPSPRRNASRVASGGRVPGSGPRTPGTQARTPGRSPASTTTPTSVTPSPRRNAQRGASGGRVPGSEPRIQATPGRSPVTPSRDTTPHQDSFTVPVTVRSRKRVLVQEESTGEADSEDDLPDPERNIAKQKGSVSKVFHKSSKSKAKEVMDDEEIKMAKANERNNSFFKQQVKEDQEFNEKMKIVLVDEDEILKCQHVGCEKEFIIGDKYKARAHVLSHRAKKMGVRGISSLNLKKCLKCHQMFQSKEIHKHYQSVHAVYKDICGECGKEFSNRKLLVQHEKIHKKLQCPYCNRQFARKDRLQEHIKSIHGARSKNQVVDDLEAVETWTDGEVKLWMERMEGIPEQDIQEEIVKKIVSVRKFNESLWLRYVRLVGTTQGQAAQIVEEALESLPCSLALWLHRIRMDPSQQTLELAVEAVGNQWGSSEVWDTQLQLYKDEEDFFSVANVYQQVLAIPTPNLERFKDEAMMFMSNLCETVKEKDVAVETIKKLFEATNKKKEQFQEFEDLIAVDSRNLSVWKRYVEKLEEVWEHEDEEDEEGELGLAMAVTNLAFRAREQCKEQEELWIWLVGRGLQPNLSWPCTVCPNSKKLHLAWAEAEEEEGRVKNAGLILLKIFNTTSDINLVLKLADLLVRHKEIVKAVDILEKTLETELTATESQKLVTRLSMILAVSGEAAKALAVVNDAINNSKCNADILKLKIDVLKIKGDYNEIIKVCELALNTVTEPKKLYFASMYDLYCSVLGISLDVKKKAESCLEKSSAQGEAGKYPCEECDKVFTVKYCREKHVICDHALEEMSCEKCFAEFNSVFELKRHLKLCKESYKCECGYSHKRKFNFNKHVC